MVKDILSCLIWLPIFLLKIVITVVGLVCIPFCLVGVKIPKDITKWEMIELNKLGWLYQNLRDGCLGDIRLDYWNGVDQYPQWMKSPKLKAWYWLAVRNPFNRNRYMKGLGCDVREHTVTLLAGDPFVSDTKESYGWQFVKAGGYYGFYCYIPIMEGRYFRVRVGHKIEPRHNTISYANDNRASKAWKGTTFGISIRGER